MGKYLDSVGVSVLWNKVKNLIKTKVEDGIVDKLGKADGIATLGEDAKLTESQLPTLKTVNGESIVGDGDITIDTTIAKVVTELPTENIVEDKTE